jgi:serine/threonine-protein kinase
LAVRQQNERPLPPSTYNEDVPEAIGAAVLRALEGDPLRRYSSAEALADGLERGLAGEDVTLPLADDDTPTRQLGGETATRPLDRTAATEYRPSPPAPPPRRRPSPPQPAAAPAPRRKRSGFSRFVRALMALIALIVIAGAVAVMVILLTDKAAGVEIREVAGDTVDNVVSDLKQLVRDNTQ